MGVFIFIIDQISQIIPFDKVKINADPAGKMIGSNEIRHPPTGFQRQ
jgi:hypothetical protein